MENVCSPIKNSNITVTVSNDFIVLPKYSRTFFDWADLYIIGRAAKNIQSKESLTSEVSHALIKYSIVHDIAQYIAARIYIVVNLREKIPLIKGATSFRIGGAMRKNTIEMLAQMLAANSLVFKILNKSISQNYVGLLRTKLEYDAIY